MTSANYSWNPGVVIGNFRHCLVLHVIWFFLLAIVVLDLLLWAQDFSKLHAMLSATCFPVVHPQRDAQLCWKSPAILLSGGRMSFSKRYTRDKKLNSLRIIEKIPVLALRAELAYHGALQFQEERKLALHSGKPLWLHNSPLQEDCIFLWIFILKIISVANLSFFLMTMFYQKPSV